MNPSLDRLTAKIYPDRRELKRHLEAEHAGRRVVFTNGCFDILHMGHLTYLSRARDLGDLLVVGLNSDESVRRLKGADRPVNSQEERAFLLAGLFFVDYVTIFSEQTPVETIEILKPTIHTKGGDYAPADLPEGRVVESYGGRVVLLPFVEGYSTTSIIRKMRGEDGASESR